tara:strand:+ start:8187 stop:8966 length:780 start_codon:yes stop_codon:yes gene_type:complete
MSLYTISETTQSVGTGITVTDTLDSFRKKVNTVATDLSTLHTQAIRGGGSSIAFDANQKELHRNIATDFIRISGGTIADGSPSIGSRLTLFGGSDTSNPNVANILSDHLHLRHHSNQTDIFPHVNMDFDRSNSPYMFTFNSYGDYTNPSKAVNILSNGSLQLANFAGVMDEFGDYDSSLKLSNKGALYFDTTGSTIRLFDGTGWPKVVLETTDGVIQLPTSSSDPSSNLAAGQIYYNTSINKLKFYNGSAFETVSSSPS